MARVLRSEMKIPRCKVNCSRRWWSIDSLTPYTRRALAILGDRKRSCSSGSQVFQRHTVIYAKVSAGNIDSIIAAISVTFWTRWSRSCFIYTTKASISRRYDSGAFLSYLLTAVSVVDRGNWSFLLCNQALPRNRWKSEASIIPHNKRNLPEFRWGKRLLLAVWTWTWCPLSRS